MFEYLQLWASCLLICLGFTTIAVPGFRRAARPNPPLKAYRFSRLSAVQRIVPFWLAMSPLHFCTSRKPVLTQRPLLSWQVAYKVVSSNSISLQVAMYEPGGSTPLTAQFRMPLTLATPSAQRLASLSEVGVSRPSML